MSIRKGKDGVGGGGRRANSVPPDYTCLPAPPQQQPPQHPRPIPEVTHVVKGLIQQQLGLLSLSPGVDTDFAIAMSGLMKELDI